MNIINFGSCNIDYVYTLDHIVKTGETQTSYSLETFAGGKGLNQSVAAARAGGRVYHAGFIGQDGEFLGELLAQSGVNLTYIKETSIKNGHAMIQVDKNAKNCIVLYPGSNELLTKEYITDVLDNFAKGDLVVLQNEVNLVDFIVEQAHLRGMAVVLNPSPYNEKIEKIDLNKVSYLLLNEVEGEQLTGEQDPEKILSFFEKNYPALTVVLTLGEQGCYCLQKENVFHQPALLVEAVDTTAAGDTFTGYLVAGVARGEDLCGAVQTATAASAIAVTRKGAAPSIPIRDEVERMINERKGE